MRKDRGGYALLLAVTLLATLVAASSCVRVTVRVGTRSTEPLKEVTLEGREKGKVVVIPVRGTITDSDRKGLTGVRAGTVQEVVAQLRLAEKDREVAAVLLEIDSPGGPVTASDILYHELIAFKERKKAKIMACFMDVAASGAYYLALAADRIVAHPTTITGSVGVVLVRPHVEGLMDKIGFDVEVSKSGSEKDMGSPFRPSTPEEQLIFQDLTDRMAGRFLSLVEKHRRLDPVRLREVSSARIYLADDALRVGLIDGIAYMSDAIAELKTMAGLPKEARVIAYRRTKVGNDNIYNPASLSDGPGLSLIELGLPEILPLLSAGPYYLWLPGTVSGKQ